MRVIARIHLSGDCAHALALEPLADRLFKVLGECQDVGATDVRIDMEMNAGAYDAKARKRFDARWQKRLEEERS
jgi:hypothetical protein